MHRALGRRRPSLRDDPSLHRERLRLSVPATSRAVTLQCSGFVGDNSDKFCNEGGPTQLSFSLQGSSPPASRSLYPALSTHPIHQSWEIRCTKSSALLGNRQHLLQPFDGRRTWNQRRLLAPGCVGGSDLPDELLAFVPLRRLLGRREAPVIVCLPLQRRTGSSLA